MTQALDSARQLLRHTLATAAYRAGKTVRGAPETFAEFRIGEKSRTPARILAHMGDLLDWGLSMARGGREWHNSEPLEWNAEVERFFSAAKRFDEYLASSEPLHASVEKLFQGPVADVLNHVGQLAMLRRLRGSPIRGENYFVADIAAGRCGADQPAAKFEFD